MFKAAIIKFVVPGIFVCTLPLHAISHFSQNPRSFPYVFVKEDDFTPRTFVADVDNNGISELLVINTVDQSNDQTFIICYSADHEDQWQVNMHRPIRGDLHFIDVDSDGTLETLVPYSRNDSLFVSVIDHQGHHMSDIFLIHGQPRIRNGQAIRWDPELVKVFYKDIDHDNEPELISIVSTGIARAPRGVLVHSLSGQKLLGSCLFGSPPSALYTLDDFNQDGTFELVFLTSAPGNGASVNGLDDSHCYLVRVEFLPQPVIKEARHITNTAFSSAHGFYTNFAGDNQPEFVTIRKAGNAKQNAQIKVFDPADFSLRARFDFAFPIKTALAYQRPGEPYFKMWVITTDNKLKIINNLFQVEETYQLPAEFKVITRGPDTNRDGTDEIVMTHPEHSMLLDFNLKILAAFPGYTFKGYIKKGGTDVRYLVQNLSAHAFRLERNHFYLYHRYRRFINFFAPALLFIVLSGLLAFTCHKVRVLDFAFDHLYDEKDNDAAIVNSSLIIKHANKSFRAWLPDVESRKKPSLDRLLIDHPQTLTAVNNWLRNNDLTFTTCFKFGTDKNLVQLEMIRLPRIRFFRRLYLVTLKDLSVESEKQRAKNWTVLARRIAHDIKSPLGSILLLAQRIRSIVHQNGAEHEKITPLLEKIEDRINSLRTMTRNLLKYANLEALHLTSTNLNSFVESVMHKIKPGLPADTELKLDFCKESPVLLLDQEQIESVLENLANNAIDSMPHGGALIVSTRLAHRLQIRGCEDNQIDYAVIEIRDTGMGFPESIREKLFEPNFSYSKESSGLGLTIVKKIITDHHGFIDVESEQGVGSIFTVFLPLSLAVKKTQHDVTHVL